jgi:hypothetical protein
MHPAKEPTDAECHDRCGIRLSFDCCAQPFVEVHSCIARSVSGLTVKVLCGTGRLVEFSLKLRCHVASGATDALFDLAAEVFGRARYAVFIHGSDPSRDAGAALVPGCSACSIVQQSSNVSFGAMFQVERTFGGAFIKKLAPRN